MTWLTIWEFVVGAAFVAGGVTARRHRGVSWLFLLAGGLLLLGPLLTALDADRASDVVAAVAVAVVLPPALLRVPGPMRYPRLFRAIDAGLVLTGTATVVLLGVGPADWSAVAATAEGTVVLAAGWLLFELSSGEQRRRVLWLVVGVSASLPAASLFLVAIDQYDLGEVLVGVVLSALSVVLPLCATVGLVDPRVMDVRVVISRATVAAVMLTLTVACYAGLVTLSTLLTGGRPGVGWLGALAALLAAAYQPVLVQVRTITDELLFGGRVDAVRTMSRLGTELSAGSGPAAWLPPLRAALAVPLVELVADGTTVARARLDGPEGEAGPGRVVTELRVGEELVGELVVGLPADTDGLPAPTRAVLGLLAGPLAQALHAGRLAEQLRASRGRVVAALEDERRRVRRDLHDGLGPTLTGIAYSADAAHNLVATKPDEAAVILAGLRSDAADAIAEIRRIVHGLRPRALDELGLVGAVRQQVARLRAADGRALTVGIDAPEQLPPLPAAVEVVAYRVVVEAVTNVARHAGVDRAGVAFELADGTLTVGVTDAGTAAGPWAPGVGLGAMRERVEEIGGTLTIETVPGANRVRAVLPR